MHHIIITYYLYERVMKSVSPCRVVGRYRGINGMTGRSKKYINARFTHCICT